MATAIDPALVLLIAGIIFIILAVAAKAVKSDTYSTLMDGGKIFLIIFAAVFISELALGRPTFLTG